MSSRVRAAVCILVCVFVCSPASAAQRLVVLGGIGYEDADLDDSRFEASTQHGWVLGVGVVRDLAGVFSLEGDFLLSGRGASVTASEIDASGEYELSYISMAALGRYHTSLRRFTPFVGVGPEVGMLLNAERSFSHGTPVPGRGDRTTFDAQEEFSTLDFGVVVLLGFGIPDSSGPFRVEARRSFGLVDVAESEKLTWHTRATHVLVGWTF